MKKVAWTKSSHSQISGKQSFILGVCLVFKSFTDCFMSLFKKYEENALIFPFVSPRIPIICYSKHIFVHKIVRNYLVFAAFNGGGLKPFKKRLGCLQSGPFGFLSGRILIQFPRHKCLFSYNFFVIKSIEKLRQHG